MLILFPKSSILHRKGFLWKTVRLPGIKKAHDIDFLSTIHLKLLFTMKFWAKTVLATVSAHAAQILLIRSALYQTA